jgi:altronate dehydratase small subunit
MSRNAIQIDEKDNVATLTEDAAAGDLVRVLNPDGAVILTAKVNEAIPFGHKLALRTLKEGDSIVKYGEVIGEASMVIKEGFWVHTHNVRSARLPSRSKEAAIL